MTEKSPPDPLDDLEARLRKAREGQRGWSGGPGRSRHRLAHRDGVGCRHDRRRRRRASARSLARHRALGTDRHVLPGGRGGSAERLPGRHRLRHRRRLPPAPWGRQRAPRRRRTLSEDDLGSAAPVPNQPVVPDRARRLRRVVHELGLLHGRGRGGDLRPAGHGRGEQVDGSGPPAVAGRDVLRVRREPGARQRRPRRQALFPVRVLDLHVRADRQHDRHDPVHLHLHQPHHRDLRAGGDGVRVRDHPGPAEARPALLLLLHAAWRSDRARPDPHPDRGDLLRDAPRQPLDPTVRQHDGRSHDAEGLCRLHGHDDQRSRRAGLRHRPHSAGDQRRPDRFRVPGGFPASLRLLDPDLPVHPRRPGTALSSP
ncbi:hypothetical protein Lal_00005142 [Lupinus albus]|nr:hypothetical protein Lal_00005142 [Lupinus albus]